MIKCYQSKNEIGMPTDEDMKLINEHTLKTLTKDDVFCFSVILCDNDIDRDFERFDESSLKTLEKLFVGKTGILNHSMKSETRIHAHTKHKSLLITLAKLVMAYLIPT